MFNRRHLTLTALLAVLFTFVGGTHAAGTSDESAGNAALAERIAQLAQFNLSGRAIVPETLRQSLLLLDAAMRLNPNEIRYPRLAAEAALQLGDTDAAINAYKAIKSLDGADQVAQLRLMDLYVGRMETADQRLEYLERLKNADGVYAEVRAHAAYLAALVRIEKLQLEEAIKLLDDALGLFPLSIEAQKKKWEIAAPRMSPKERVDLLLSMLKANPGQPGVMADLARELAGVTLIDLSLKWYGMALELAGSVGRGVETSDVNDFVSELIIADQENSGEAIIDRILQNDPGNIDSAFLSVLIQRRGGSAERLEKAKSDAQNALSVYASALSQRLNGPTQDAAAAATQPGGASIDVMADLRKLQEKDDPALRAGYASLLADLAWIELYFNGKSAEADQFLTPLKALVPEDSGVLARLEGWQLLNAGRFDEARNKLSAASDQNDPLARMGMILLASRDPANKDQVKEDALKLFYEHPTGLVGAMLADGLRDKVESGPGKGIPMQNSHDEIRKAVDQFPQAWLDFVSRPGNMYLLKADPLKVTHQYGEPILAQVTRPRGGAGIRYQAYRYRLADGVDPLEKTKHMAYYLGEHDGDGKLLDNDDPFLYWFLPIVNVPNRYKDYVQPANNLVPPFVQFNLPARKDANIPEDNTFVLDCVEMHAAGEVRVKQQKGN